MLKNEWIVLLVVVDSTSKLVVAVVVSTVGVSVVVVVVVVTTRFSSASSVAGIMVDVTASIMSLTTSLAYEMDSEMLLATDTLTS